MSDTVKVEIITDTHFHAGQPVPKGTKLEVDPIDADFLIANKIGKPTTKEA